MLVKMVVIDQLIELNLIHIIPVSHQYSKMKGRTPANFRVGIAFAEGGRRMELGKPAEGVSGVSVRSD